MSSHAEAVTHNEGMVRSTPLLCYPESWLRTQGKWDTVARLLMRGQSVGPLLLVASGHE